MQMTTRLVATLSSAALLAANSFTLADAVSDRLASLEQEVQQLKSNASSDSESAVHIGGYGELHYNNLSGENGASDKEELDFHRFVLYVGYDFSESVRLTSELEVEHSLSGDGKPGEVELEQAFIDFDLNGSHTARAGLFLLPVGLMNLTHEPTRFYGVERNPVENKIIPTTWWEAGAGFHGQLLDSVSYAAYIHSGLNTSSNSSYAVRSGRQKAAKAKASDLAGTIAVNWNNPGITVGGALVYESDVTQGSDASAGNALLLELHANVKKGPLGLRALYAEWTLDGNGPESSGADRQYGWYVEPSYRPIDSVGLFVRFSDWDNLAGDSSSDSSKAQFDVGVNWYPHPQVVLKADYQLQDNSNDKNQDGFNLGVGYDF